MTDPVPYSVPKEPGRWRAITLAVIVHIALLAFLWIGIRWQNETPVGVEAEIWSPQNQEAAPRPEPQVVEKKPEPQPEPQPAPKPVVQEIPKPPVAEPVRENPQIVLEQEKKRKAQEKREREREEHEKQAKLKQQKLEHEREEKQKQAEKERLEKQKAEALAKKEKEAEQAKKLAAEKLAAEKKRKQDAADAAAADQRRAEDMKRMLAQAGTGGTRQCANYPGQPCRQQLHAESRRPHPLEHGVQRAGRPGRKSGGRICNRTVAGRLDSLAKQSEIFRRTRFRRSGAARDRQIRALPARPERPGAGQLQCSSPPEGSVTMMKHLFLRSFGALCAHHRIRQRLGGAGAIAG